METLLIVLGAIALISGFIGCILPLLPGLPLAYVAMLLLHFTDKVQFSLTQLLTWLFLTLILQVLDFIIPMLGTKYTGGSSWGEKGCIVGSVVGLFFMPWGIVLGPFLGAFLGELLAGKSGIQALRSGIGSFLGFFIGTIAKLILCIYFCWEFISALI